MQLPSDPGLLGCEAGVETLTFTGNLARGNFTRMHHILLRP
ncbi:MAG: hypothetical protein ABIP94_00960 [Planctomycetota bacterium]